MNEKNGNGGGIPTDETRILACQCGSTGFDVKKRTKTSISLVCGKCGLRCSVKGNLATVRVRQQEIQYALEHTIVTPDDSPDDDEGGDAPGEKVGDGNGPVGNQYITLRFRIMKGDQKDVIDRAMEACRVLNCSADKFREQTWQGHALEFICADFLSGCDPNVLQIVDAMDDAVEDAERIAEDGGKKAPTARKIRDLRSKVRDKLALESGILPKDFFGDDPDAPDPRQLSLLDGGKDEEEEDGEEASLVCPECGADVEADDEQCGACGVQFSKEDDADTDTDSDTEEEEETFTPVPDEGRLLTAVTNTLAQYMEDAEEAGLANSDLPHHHIVDGSKPPKKILEKWAQEGGYLVRVLGDPRTVDAKGNRPSVTVLIESEPAGLALDFSVDYDEQTDEILGDGSVEVVELIPPDYDQVGPWAQPHFADRREQL